MYNETLQEQWHILRDTLADGSEDTDLSKTTKTWANFVATYSTEISGHAGMSKKLPKGANAVNICFDFNGKAATESANFKIYAYCPMGPAEFVCSATVSTSDANVQETDDSTTRYYGDAITTPVQYWPATVATVDAASNNGVAKICFDACGRRHILCLFDAISTGDDVRAKISWY